MGPNDRNNVIRIKLVGTSSTGHENRFTPPLHVSRNAGQLRGIISINEYEDFCNAIDALLIKQHELRVKSQKQMKALAPTFSVITILYVVLIFATVGLIYTRRTILFVTLNSFLFIIWIALIVLAQRMQLPGRNVLNEIREKCREMSDRTVSATFKYVVTHVSINGRSFEIVSINVTPVAIP
jgi:hypothetical protein